MNAIQGEGFSALLDAAAREGLKPVEVIESALYYIAQMCRTSTVQNFLERRSVIVEQAAASSPTADAPILERFLTMLPNNISDVVLRMEEYNLIDAVRADRNWKVVESLLMTTAPIH